MTIQQRLSSAAMDASRSPCEPQDWNSLPPPVEHAYDLGEHAIRKLFNTPADQVCHYEIGEMSLIAAYGLPGTRDMDMGAMLRRLDDWGKGAAAHILKSSHQFSRHRSKFNHSLARFRMTLMVQYLVQQCGIHFEPEEHLPPALDRPPLTDPRNTFIHGPLGDRRSGMCESLSVLVVAVGRKLGYPLRMVLAPQHAFCRWDTPKERFNIEMHANGLNSHPDEYYTHWPFEWPQLLHDQQRDEPFLLQSMTPAQELAHFASDRGHYLDLSGRFKEALASMKVAHRLWPIKPHRVWINHLITKLNFPDKQWPHSPCEETCGKEAILRMSKQLGITVPDNV